MQPFDYIIPKDHAEASALLAQGTGVARAFMGGTDLLIRIRGGFVRPERVVDLKHLPGIRAIGQSPDGWLVIGAACTMNQVAGHPTVQARYDLLTQACNSVASYQLRNRATLGGNICNASPAADTAPALYCLGAVVEIFGPHGARRVPIAEFFVGPGKSASEARRVRDGNPPPTCARPKCRRVQQARPDEDRRYLDGERGGVRLDEGRRTNDERRNWSFVIRHSS